jgi:YVTN family beta-propeller protein
VESAGNEARVDGLTGDVSLFCWRVASGIAHARLWASLTSVLDRTDLPGASSPNTTAMRLSASDRALAVIAGVTTSMIGAVADGDAGGGTVSVIDAATNTVTATIPVGFGPDAVAVAPATHTAYVANEGSTVSVISPVAAPGNLKNTAAPVITGAVKVGSKVSVTPGTWSPPADLTFTYQWLASGTAISGAANSSYTIPASLAGKKLSAIVTAHRTGYDSAAETSGAKTVAKGTFVITVKSKLSGTPKVGKDLSVTKGTWAPPPAIKIQWYANGKAIARATGATLKLTKTLKGKTISVIVGASRAGYATETVTLKETKKVGAG